MPAGRRWCSCCSSTPREYHELRGELEQLKCSGLQKRALAGGASEEDMERATDADDSKSALIELILGLSEAMKPDQDRIAELRAELSSMKLSGLQKRALAGGASEEDMERATDADDSKSALIELILGLPQVLDSGVSTNLVNTRPHFRAKASAIAKDGMTASVPGTLTSKLPVLPTQSNSSSLAKHVMLSYQWDHQPQVKKVHDTLVQLGVNCWMDISGGKQSGWS